MRIASERVRHASSSVPGRRYRPAAQSLKLAKISYSSPIAKALIGKSAGDVAEVRTPGGVKEFEIVDVRYG